MIGAIVVILAILEDRRVVTIASVAGAAALVGTIGAQVYSASIGSPI